MIITKEQVLETIQELPQQFSLEELVERLSIFDAGANDIDFEIKQTASVVSSDKMRFSLLRKRIQTPMTNEAIDQQVENLRDEWQRDI